MAEHKRLNFRQADSVRTHIKAIHLVKAMQDHALGKREMTGTQIQAGSFLLSKVLSNPAERKELSGPDGGAIPLAVKVTFVDP